MPEWFSYLFVFLLGILVGRAFRGSSRDETHAPERPAPPLSADVDSQVRRLLAERKKIQAIKLFRDSTGVGLKEAKEAVERIETQVR